MHKILTIMRREYIETVRTKTFLVSIFITPFLMVGIFFLAGSAEKMASRGAPARRIAVTVPSKDIEQELKDRFEQHNTARPSQQILPTFRETDSPEETGRELEEAGRSGEFDGYLAVAAGVVDGEGASQFYTRKPSDLTLYHTISRLVNDAVRNTRFRNHGMSPELIAELQRGVALEQIDVRSKEKAKARPILAMIAPFFFVFMMFMGMFAINQQMLTSVIEEKSSRVMEVLLAAVSPARLMTGKILGLGAVGLTVVAIWTGAACVAASAKGVASIANASTLAYFALYYVPGFLLFSAIFAAGGSACNTLKDAQTLVMPMALVMVVPMMAWLPISQRPDGALAVTLSFIPPFTPLVMVLRLAASPEVPAPHIVGSIVLLLASVVIAMKASAKIFRTGILMYGKPATAREIVRWLFHE